MFRALRPYVERDPDTVLICDGGEFAQWGQSMLPVRRRMINGVAGSIGGSLSFANAARLAEPKAPVFAVLGDGTIGFHLSEFETAVRRKLPFVAVLGNDALWNAESQIQLREYGRERMHGCDLTPARYDLAVAALGGHGEYRRTRRGSARRDRALACQRQARLHQRDDREHRGAGDPAVMRDTVIFDLGGVLIDWNPRYLFRKLFDDEQAMEQFLGTVCTPDWHRQHDAGKQFAETRDELTQRYPQHAALIDAFGERHSEMMEGAIDGTVALLERLAAANVPLFAITNFPAQMYLVAQQRFPFLGLFRDVAVSGYERVVKPDPALFHILLRRNDIAPLAGRVHRRHDEPTSRPRMRSACTASILPRPRRLSASCARSASRAAS